MLDLPCISLTGENNFGFRLIQAWAAVLNALAWPVAILIIAFILRTLVLPAVSKGGGFIFKVKGMEFTIVPAQVARPHSTSADKDLSQRSLSIDERCAYVA
jgi:hypothetical protein